MLNYRPFVPRPRLFSLWRVLALAFVLALPAAGASSAASPTAVPQQAAEDVQIVRQFDTPEAVIALTFDAGADRGYAEQILDTLAGRDVKASFGMTGIWAEQNPDLVQRIYAEGHHFINHSWDHPHFPAISSAERVDQLARTDDLVYELTGARTKPYFRPPYGEYNADVLADLAANGYTWMIMWTVDTLGWNGYSASQISERVLAGAAPGAIILMHVGAASQDAAALPGMIDQLRARGYRFATVEELATGVSSGEHYFPETGKWVRDEFLAYWRRFGGLDIFGYPLTDAFEREGRLLQHFERARFELYPGSWPERYDVVLGRLGYELTRARIAAGEQPFLPIVADSDANCDFHPETGHRLCFGFRDYWRSRGGLAIFGYPLSEEFNERNRDTGRIYTVQYFERARFEWHPGEGGTASLVLLGRLGAQLVDAE